MVAMKADL
jgi:hypothetical protein